jgi:SAM-dependent methyltransferase
MALDPEIEAFYARGGEPGRLDHGYFPLERARTQEIVLRHLPQPPAVVLDVGGAAGAYAFWLSERGYAVHLIDPVPLHVDEARRVSGRSAHPLAGVAQGDARSLPHADACADAVLLLGPLYHLVAREDRLRALREARRVLRPGGFLFAAAISRFASLIDNLTDPVDPRDRLPPVFADAAVLRMVRQDLAGGPHENTSGDARYFTTAYFHDPAELRGEMAEADLALEDVLPLESLGAFTACFPSVWADPGRRETLLALVRSIEREPSLLGISPHLLAVARRSGTPSG